MQSGWRSHCLSSFQSFKLKKEKGTPIPDFTFDFYVRDLKIDLGTFVNVDLSADELRRFLRDRQAPITERVFIDLFLKVHNRVLAGVILPITEADVHFFGIVGAFDQWTNNNLQLEIHKAVEEYFESKPVQLPSMTDYHGVEQIITEQATSIDLVHEIEYTMGQYHLTLRELRPIISERFRVKFLKDLDSWMLDMRNLSKRARPVPPYKGAVDWKELTKLAIRHMIADRAGFEDLFRHHRALYLHHPRPENEELYEDVINMFAGDPPGAAYSATLPNVRLDAAKFIAIILIELGVIDEAETRIFPFVRDEKFYRKQPLRVFRAEIDELDKIITATRPRFVVDASAKGAWPNVYAVEDDGHHKMRIVKPLRRPDLNTPLATTEFSSILNVATQNELYTISVVRHGYRRVLRATVRISECLAEMIGRIREMVTVFREQRRDQLVVQRELGIDTRIMESKKRLDSDQALLALLIKRYISTTHPHRESLDNYRTRYFEMEEKVLGR